MKCDLCNHQDGYSENNLLCEGCTEMIQRLVVVQQRINFHEPQIAATAAA